MPTLAQRDASATFSPRAGELRELTDRRTRAAKVFELPPAPDGRRRYRVGAGIGPVHYPSDVWADAPDWHEIDLEIRETAKGQWAMKAAGYSARFWQQTERQKPLNYIGEFSRGGATYRMAPLSLSWQDADGKEERIAKTTAGIDPRIDPDAYTITWEDAFGAGLSYGYNLQPDKLFKVLTIGDRKALSQPRRINGERLVLRLWVSWDGDGIPDEDLPSVAGDYTEAKAEPTTRRPPGRYAHKHIERALPCFWVQPPEAWDSDDETQQRWALDWWYERRGTEVVLCLALDAEALKSATYPLLMDTAISEEQVGASTDDARDNGSTCNTSDSTITLSTAAGTSNCGMRFTTVPLPAGCTIDSASISVYLWFSNTYDDPNLDIYCEDADSAATFGTSSPNRPMDRAKTTAYTLWRADNLGAAGWKVSPDISDPVQEVIDRASWASGNALAVITDDLGTYSFTVRTYDFSGNTSGAKLNATYTEDLTQTASPAAASRTATAYAATASPGAVTVAPGLAASTPTAYQVTGIDAGITASPALASRTAAAYAPTAQPGAIAAVVAAATRTPTAYDATAAPGAVIAAPAIAQSTAQAFAATATPGTVVASVDIAARTAEAYQPTTQPGAIAALPALAERIAEAYQSTALPGVVTAEADLAARTAEAYQATASPGVVTVAVDLASRTAAAYSPTAAPGAIVAAAAAALRSAVAYSAEALPGAVNALPAIAARTPTAYDATAQLSAVDQTVSPAAALRTALALTVTGVVWEDALLASQGRLAVGYLDAQGRLAVGYLDSQGRLAVGYLESDGRGAVDLLDSEGRAAVGYLNSQGRTQ